MKIDIGARRECPVCHATYRIYMHDECPNCGTPEVEGVKSEDIDVLHQIASAIEPDVTREQAFAIWYLVGDNERWISPVDRARVPTALIEWRKYEADMDALKEKEEAVAKEREDAKRRIFNARKG